MKLSNKTQALQDLIAPAVQACDVDLWGIEYIPQEDEGAELLI